MAFNEEWNGKCSSLCMGILAVIPDPIHTRISTTILPTLCNFIFGKMELEAPYFWSLPQTPKFLGFGVLRFRSRVLRFRVLGASFSSFWCFVFEFWVLRFRDLGVLVFDLGCFVFETTGQKRLYSSKNSYNEIWRRGHQRIWIDNIIYSSWVSAKLKCGYSGDSNFAAHLLSLEMRRR